MASTRSGLRRNPMVTGSISSAVLSLFMATQKRSLSGYVTPGDFVISVIMTPEGTISSQDKWPSSG